MPPCSFSSQAIGMVYFLNRGSRISYGSMMSTPADQSVVLSLSPDRRILGGGRRAPALGRGIDREPDRDDQDSAVEEVLHVEGCPQLLHAGEGEGEDQHGQQRPHDIDPARMDGGRAQQSRSEERR